FPSALREIVDASFAGLNRARHALVALSRPASAVQTCAENSLSCAHCVADRTPVATEPGCPYRDSGVRNWPGERLRSAAIRHSRSPTGQQHWDLSHNAATTVRS